MDAITGLGAVIVGIVATALSRVVYDWIKKDKLVKDVEDLKAKCGSLLTKADLKSIKDSLTLLEAAVLSLSTKTTRMEADMEHDGDNITKLWEKYDELRDKLSSSRSIPDCEKYHIELNTLLRQTSERIGATDTKVDVIQIETINIKESIQRLINIIDRGV